MLETVQARIKKVVGKVMYAPQIKVESGAKLERLGSTYGAWTFEASDDLHGATIRELRVG